jgi:hypothetical protein
MKKLTIHCWGGLGSQLYAWAMAEMVQINFPNRRVELIIHSSGVTKRFSELEFLKSDFNIKFVDDYSSTTETNRISKPYHNLIKIFVKKFLYLTNIILYCNKNHELKKIKPWTLSLRGHYSHVNLDIKIIQSMLSRICSEYQIPLLKFVKQDKALSIHYRLGDLQHLTNKTYINPNSLGDCIEKILLGEECKSVIVYSDEPKVAQLFLQDYLPKETVFANSEIWNTLLNLVSTNYFIGTNSKISLWAAIFRKSIDNHAWVYLPEQMRVAAENNLLNLEDHRNIHYY